MLVEGKVSLYACVPHKMARRGQTIGAELVHGKASKRAKRRASLYIRRTATVHEEHEFTSRKVLTFEIGG